jgi:hypothetical protein
MATIRREVTGRRLGAVAQLPKLSALVVQLPSLTALDLERHISVREAAAFKGISEDTFKRHYSNLIRKQSPRRNTVKVRDLLETDES